MKRFATSQSRWSAVQARDPSADGAFYYAVKTTGVFCRPTCPARQAKRENVIFYSTVDDAQHAGFRPCKRCRPDEISPAGKQIAAVAGACRMIESAPVAPRLNALAGAAGLSPHHFHRVFKAALGITPKAYAMAHRAQRTRGQLHGSRTVTNAIYGAGFNSSGRFYSSAPRMLGMPPRKFRAGGAGILIRHTVAECSLGKVLVAMTDLGICAIFLGDDANLLTRQLKAQFKSAGFVPIEPQFAEWTAKIVAMIENPTKAVSLPLDIQGTAFQQRVWNAMQKIPIGQTTTYTQIAQQIGQPNSTRAVARACAANRLAVAIPCHRVVRKDGHLAGYRWNINRKRELLRREGTPFAPSDAPGHKGTAPE